MNDLKPCPFCGESAKLWNDGKVSCSNPGCGCWKSHLQENAVPFYVDDWNTRTPEKQSTPEELRFAIGWAETIKKALQTRDNMESAAATVALDSLLKHIHHATRADGSNDFITLVNLAVAEAEKAMKKYPQPNYVISKIAEEAGEVVKAAIHCAEGRETVENLCGEMTQLIAMLYRLWNEGDQVHGLRIVKGGAE